MLRDPCLYSVAMIGELFYTEPFHRINKARADLKRLWELEIRKQPQSRAVVAHACNPSTLGGRDRQISEFEASLVYRMSSRTPARATQRNPVWENKQTQNPKNKNQPTN